MARVLRADFVGRLDGRTVLGDGSVRFTARLTRTGVFDYGDHAELRTPEEVFSKTSLDSFRNLTVTEGHQVFVDSENWREVAIGHVGDDVRQDGVFVVASVVIKDANALKKIDAQDPAQRLVEISMGYTVTLEDTAGVTDTGEKYDAIQRDIVGNHAALGPVGWGRAGANVRLLDSSYAPPQMANTVQRIDAPAALSANDLQKELDAARADNESLRKDRDEKIAEAAKRADTSDAERDQTRKDLTDSNARADALRAEFDAFKAQAAAEVEARCDAMLTLRDSARSVLGKDFSFSGKDARAVRLAAIAKVDSTIDLSDKSDDYVTARFDTIVESVSADREGLSQIQKTVSAPVAAEKSRLDQANEKAAADAREAAKAGPPPGAAVRK